VGDSDFVFVADKGYRIQRFTREGEFDTLWTHPDTALIGGDAVATYPGSVYTHWMTGGDRLFRHDLDGNVIVSFAPASWLVEYPKDLATDSHGNLYVADWATTRVSKWDSLGNYVEHISFPSWPPPYESLCGIAVDPHRSIYISDPAQDCVHKYRLLVSEVENGLREEPWQPARLRQAQNYPNPFGSTTTIGYSLPSASPVSLAIYNIRGALVVTLMSGERSAGRHQVDWDGRDERGQRVGSGIYFCHLETGTHAETRRMVLLR
jgi:hypothetical protein